MEKRYLTNIGKLSENSRGMNNEKENFWMLVVEKTLMVLIL